MDHLTIAQFLSLLVVTLGAAKLCGALAKAVGQPTVLGELLAGVLLGSSVLGSANSPPVMPPLVSRGTRALSEWA